ncbi:hypothetical protein R69658_07471 [Paraburkholderia aspalathi]|uniref:Helicase ATP-binding domain-containing protein n=1 Tax=Paraburkholderia aspalathi TaxID=1324617 RepID=A0ABN7N6Y0_9BURK|nr:DEAD/DEAH box helicase family protein [Paraburkholderia aspalathi]MBK3823761.1 DEAD/DEAH box helicase family protein [Paraburkholderia aspalathi]MBK3835610.1 DEAD/DEAH box helicase family protein [Paraburkholderia aspalathi]MBK3865381.1 DEAD/DEAH box helicase family protein [Paraburkholderia aspalathi]CAE6857732.1 hypothetical protein R69658_07471 [Paraburkholderia aspalathi]
MNDDSRSAEIGIVPSLIEGLLITVGRPKHASNERYTMNLKTLVADQRTSIRSDAVDARLFSQNLRRLKGYNFWDGQEDAPRLWEHQRAAIATVVAYLSGDKTIPEHPELKEAALLKLPTGTGKSGIIAVVSRCLPSVRRALVLTPRAALTEQLMADIRYRFWGYLGYRVDDTGLFTAEAEITGRDLEDVFVEQLLLTNVDEILRNVCDDGTDRAILVGTHQALGDVRKRALDLDADGATDCQALLDHIGEHFDLVIVDEGHYEPAIAWSRGVRDFNLATVLLSATPYRNDYKSFRVRGRYLFNFPYQQAVDQQIIRSTEVVVPEAHPEIGREAAIAQFIGILHRELPGRLTQAARWFRDGVEPKVMVRGDDLETLILLQTEVDRVFRTQSVLIHDRAKAVPENPLRFASVSAARRARPDATFWVHQNKLMEGIDDPTFVAVGVFDLMSNARQLVQQIGRATRYARGGRRGRQTAWILGSPANAARIQSAWERYKRYEDYAARNTAHMVSNEVTLPDRLLEYMAEYQYIDGEFRGRFEFEHPLASSDIQLPRTATVLRTAEPLADIHDLGTAIEDAIADRDRFKIVPIAHMPENAIGFSYYAWRNSPYLVDRFFSEWTLGIFVAVMHGEFVCMHDTQGLVVDMAELKLTRASRSVMEKAFPEQSDGNPSRVSRMSFSSLDMSQHAIRGMALRTRSFAEVFTDLLDPSLVPATAAGFVNGSARYVGFARARLRDASETHVPLSSYIAWTAEIAAELRDPARSRCRIFGRYAAVVENVDPNEAQPVSILLDPSLDEMRDDDQGLAGFVLDENVDYFDLCSDVAAADGKFVIRIGNEEVPCAVEYIQATGKYRISSDRLNEKYLPREQGERRQRQTLVQRLNQRQAFRILTRRAGMVYSEGSFYEPRLRWRLEDNSNPILDYVYASPTLQPVDSEKGEGYFSVNLGNWYRQSVFGLFAAVCESRLAANGIGEDDLTKAINAIPIWLCDDDNREVADFIGLDLIAKRIVLVHAKIGNQDQGGSGFNVDGLQIVGRQALASLGFLSRGQPSPVWTRERWESDVQANTVILRGRNRLFRGSNGMSTVQLNDALLSACINPSFDREIWIVGAKMVRRQALADGLAQQPHENRLRQFLMHWDAMQTACARANTRLKLFC